MVKIGDDCMLMLELCSCNPCAAKRWGLSTVCAPCIAHLSAVELVVVGPQSQWFMGTMYTESSWTHSAASEAMVFAEKTCPTVQTPIFCQNI